MSNIRENEFPQLAAISERTFALELLGETWLLGPRCGSQSRRSISVPAGVSSLFCNLHLAAANALSLLNTAA